MELKFLERVGDDRREEVAGKLHLGDGSEADTNLKAL